MKRLLVVLTALVLTSSCSRYSSSITEVPTQEPINTPEPTVTFAPTPSPTAVSICDPARVGALSVLYCDDFSNPKSGWGALNDNGVTASYVEGVYKIVGDLKGIGTEISLAQKFPQDTIIETDIQFLEKTDPSIEWYNQERIQFSGRRTRASEGAVFYAFNITSGGYVWIEKLPWIHDNKWSVWNADPIQLTEPKQISGFKLGEVNRFRADMVGDVLTIYINSELAATVNDHFETKSDTFSINIRVGPTFEALFVIKEGMDIRVDNFCIYAP